MQDPEEVEDPLQWILDNMPVKYVDYTKTEFEKDVQKHIESYPNFPEWAKNKIWNTVQDVRQDELDRQKEEVDKILEEAGVEEPAREKAEQGFLGYLKKIGRKVKKFFGRLF